MESKKSSETNEINKNTDENALKHWWLHRYKMKHGIENIEHEYWETTQKYWEEHKEWTASIETLLEAAKRSLEEENEEPTWPTTTIFSDRVVENEQEPLYKETTAIHDPPKESVTIPAKQLLGTTYKMQKILERILLHNCKNRIGTINYNKNGKRGHETKQLTPYFCDNFLLSCVVLASNCKGQNCSETSVQNKLIRQFLKSANFPPNRNIIKAISCHPYTPTKHQIRVYKRMNPFYEEEQYSQGFNKQIFKIACADLDPQGILDTLTPDTLERLAEQNIIFEDIDFTIDFSGSFNQHEVREHLREYHGYKDEYYDEIGWRDIRDEQRIIKENDYFVGSNCLTFYHKSGHYMDRCKIYNKFAQTAESAGVRKSIGSHLLHWLNNPSKRLTQTIEAAQETGVTRAEITFYERVPTKQYILQELATLQRDALDPAVLYTTPIREQWKAITEQIKHFPIVYSPSTKEAVCALWVNEKTRKINGARKGYTNTPIDPRDLTYMAGYLSPKTEVDIIYVDVKMEKGKPQEVTLSTRSFMKVDKRTEYKGTTFLSSGTSYLYMSSKKNINPADRGLVPTPTIQPAIPVKKVTKNSKQEIVFVELKSRIELVTMSPEERDRIMMNTRLEELRVVARKEKEEQRAREKEIYEKIQEARTKAESRLRKVSREFRHAKAMKVTDPSWEVGGIKIITEAFKHNNSTYGTVYKLRTRKGEYFWSNTQIRDYLDRLDLEHMSTRDETKTSMFSGKGRGILGLKKLKQYWTKNRHRAAKFYIQYNTQAAKGGLSTLVETAKEEVKQIETHALEKGEYKGKHKDLKRLEKLELGTSIVITKYSPYTYRGKTKYALTLEGLKGQWLCNYWASKVLETELKTKVKEEYKHGRPRIYMVIGAPRTTPNKRKELTVKQA